MPAQVASLPVLAAALRDREWVDMGVLDREDLQRVRVKAIIVKLEQDELVVEQLTPVADTVERIELVVDAEKIAWLRPTQVDPFDVEPMVPREKPEAIIAEIVRTVAWLTEDCTEDDITKPFGNGQKYGPDGSYKALRPRQEAMFLAHEMTDLSPAVICKDYFGYGSHQPLLTVYEKLRWGLKPAGAVAPKFRPGEGAKAWRERVRKTAGLIDSHFGKRYRRSASFTETWGPYLETA